MESVKRILLGEPRDPTDPKVFHKLSLVAFLAWVGLGDDGLTSSCYGPDFAYRVILAHKYLAFHLAIMTAVEEAEPLCQEIAKAFPTAIFFLGKLIFAKEKPYYRVLHNDTAFAIQRRLQFSGLQTVVLPIRMNLE